MGSKMVCIPKLDFSHLEPGNTAVWDALQGELMRALESYGCFEVAYDRVTLELRDALFDRAWPEMFGLPLDIKMLTKSDLPTTGYIGQIPGFPYESLVVPGEDVEKFTRMFWPEGNLTFCDTVSTYIRHLEDLERIIVRMLFRGLGIEKYYDSYTESNVYVTRASEYGAPLDPESKISLDAHIDPFIVSIVGQKQEGLELQTKNGEWIPVVPSPNSFAVLIGETIQAWSNGKIQPTFHRVRITGNEKRYSAIFASFPKEDFIIQTPEELVDEEHPLIYKPYVLRDYNIFRYSDGGFERNKTLFEFCGIRKE